MPSYPNRKYVILETKEVEDIDFDKIIENSIKNLRFSKDAKYTFIKFEGKTPSFYNGKDEYTHYEMTSILNNKNGIWFIDEDNSLSFIDIFNKVVDNITWKNKNPFN